MQLILASASPRRLELLRLVGFAPVVQSLDLPEVRAPGETPRNYCLRVATAKARAVYDQLGGANGERSEAIAVLGADTEVVLDDTVFGKPIDAEDAAAMLARLSGRTHEVITTLALIVGGECREAVQTSAVKFKTLSAHEVRGYVASGECFGKAGAYAIQGLGGTFIEFLQGSYTGVMGLPTFEATALLNASGVYAQWQGLPEQWARP